MSRSAGGAEDRPDSSTFIAFAGAVLIGGTNFVAVKFSNEDLDPSFGAALRFSAAALIFSGLALGMRLKLPRGRSAWGAVLYGALGFGVGYAALYQAIQGLGAGTTSVFMASTPLITLVFAVAHGQERFTLRGLLGGILAVAGIAVLSSGSVSGDVRLFHVVMAVVGLAATAESAVIIKAFPGAHPISTNAVGMAAGCLFLFPASWLSGESWTLPSSTRTWLVLLWLIVAGSVGLFSLILFVVKRWTASATVYALTLMPVVAVALGALVADEPLTPELGIGGGLVLAAVYVGAISGSRRARDGASMQVDDVTPAGIGPAPQDL